MDPEIQLYYPPTCSLNFTDSDIQPDADIVGIGVLVSFVISAWLLWFVHLAAWWFDALPECLDDRLLWLQNAHAKGKRIEEGHRTERAKAMAQIVTSLSDQQLILGTSILIASLGRYRQIDTYSVNIVIDLAYLAASVHIMSMDLTDFPPGKQIVLKIVRTIFMVCNAIMMIYFLTMQTCWNVGSHSQYLSFDCASRLYLQVGWHPEDIIDLISFLVVASSLAFNYYSAIDSLWHGNYADPGIWLVPSRLLEQVQGDIRIIQREVYRHEANECYQSLNRAGASTLSCVGRAEAFAFLNTRGAVEWTLITFLFPLVYGTGSLFRDRSAFEQSASLNQPGFGQIVPLVLLILPILAALQSRNDYVEEITTTSSQQESVTEMEDFAETVTIPVAQDSSSAQDVPLPAHDISNMSNSEPPLSPIKDDISTVTALETTGISQRLANPDLHERLAGRSGRVSRVGTSRNITTQMDGTGDDQRAFTVHRAPTVNPTDASTSSHILLSPTQCGTFDIPRKSGLRTNLTKEHYILLTDSRVKLWSRLWMMFHEVMTPLFGLANVGILPINSLIFVPLFMINTLLQFRYLVHHGIRRYRYLRKQSHVGNTKGVKERSKRHALPKPYNNQTKGT